jgi:CBS domain-containing protein
MSPRAAWRLESLGFTQAYDYAAGKADWAAAGLPIEGELSQVLRIGDLAERDVPTCRLGDRLGRVREQVRAAGVDLCVVVNDQRIVLGVLRRRALEGDDDALAEDAMAAGPSTFRASVSCHEMVGYMQKRDIRAAIVTDADGRLVGLLRRLECERRAEELRAVRRVGGWPIKGW